MALNIYRSSAGSGKTFSLVTEYLKMVLRHPAEFRHILAITFTNKAANEMKDRVMKALTAFASPNRPFPSASLQTMWDNLREANGFTPDQMQSQAQEALTLILHHYGEFAIGTIDGFSHRVIRAFAHDFNLPVSFQVSLDEEELLKRSVDLLLDKAGRDRELTDLLVRFLESRIEEDRGWNIEGILNSFATILLKEESQLNLKLLKTITIRDFERITKALFSRMRGFEARLKTLGDEGLALISEKGLDHAVFYRGRAGFPKYLEYLSEKRGDKYRPNQYVVATIQEDRWTGTKATEADKNVIEDLKDRLVSLFHETQSVIEAEYEDYRLFQLLTKNIFPLAVINEIGQLMEGLKRQQNLVHISEFNTAIAAIVLNEPVPFIYERLGEKYHHLLIDEFQDTSRLQWHNFVPLMENALASNYFNLIVGDGKQAIYRWRNGDVTQFANLPNLEGSDQNPLIQQRQEVLKAHAKEQTLDDNFRSGYEIVKFNNNFFRWLSGQFGPLLSEIYKQVEQNPRSDLPGSVSIEFIDSSGGTVQDYQEHTYARVESIIREMTQNKGYALHDLAILCRTNQEGSLLARMLIEHHIDVVSSESLLLSYAPEIRFILGFLGWLRDPHNMLLQGAILTFLWQTHRLRSTHKDLHTWLSMLQVPSASGPVLTGILNREGYVFDRNEFLSLPIYDQCETLIRLFELDQEDNLYIRFFLDAVLEYSAFNKFNPVSFETWWELHGRKQSVVIPEGLDAVQIMTIHKAKGLEFPVVIAPFADNEFKLNTHNTWISVRASEELGLPVALLPLEKALEETSLEPLLAEEHQRSILDQINLLYVVMTRASEALFIISRMPLDEKDDLKSVPQYFRGYLQHIQQWDPGLQKYHFGIVPTNRRKALQSLHTETSGNPGIYPTDSSGPPGSSGQMQPYSPKTSWRKRIRIRSQAPYRWNLEDPETSLEFGTRIHEMLAGISTHKDLKAHFRELALQGILDPEEEQGIRELITKVIEHPELKPYFGESWQIRNEPEILDGAGELYRPDRVVIHDEKVAILEYKTGKPLSRHQEQLKHYGRLLEDLGYSDPVLLLVYIGKEIQVRKI